jgi:ATP-dependent Lon protease
MPAKEVKKSTKMEKKERLSEKDKQKMHRKKKADSDSDSDSSDDDDEEEMEWETESDDSSYHPPEKKTKKRSSKKLSRKCEESDDEEDTDDERVKQFIKKIKAKQDKPKPTKSKKSKYVVEESEEEEDDESEDEYEEDECDDEDDDDEEAKKNVYIMFGGGVGGDEGMYEFETNEEMENAEIEEALENDDDECDSEDEKTFMKEEYKVVDCPSFVKETTKQTKKQKGNNTKQKKPASKVEEEEPRSVEEEYKELIDIRCILTEKLKENPKSKIILKTLQSCRDSISKLVKNARTKNAKEYHKLTKTEMKNATAEIDYFKKKLSHKEQKAIMNELKEINEHIHIDKPYRLALLQTKLPIKYKATVMQKLNMMKSMEQGDSEYHKMKTWVDTFMRVPFNVYKSLSVNMSDGMDVCDQFMKNAKSQLDDCVYGLDDAKLQILQMMGQWITNPDAMGSAIAIHGPPGTGKCFAIDTPILMYDGTIKNVQNVIVGDILMGDDSTPRNVLGLGRGKDEMYDIISIKGEKYTVNSEHILSLKLSGLNRIRQVRNIRGDIGYKTQLFNKNTYEMNYKTFSTFEEADTYIFDNTQDDGVVDITVKDFLKLPEKIQNKLKGYKTGVEFSSKPVLFNPYIIGIWLGDGTSSKSEVTNQDSKILHYLRTELKKDDMNLSHIDKYQYGIVGDLHQKHPHGQNMFRNVLTHYQLWNNKHVPDDYKINDRETRLQLLAGLIDSDGYYSSKGNYYEITQKNKILADDIIFIARSLGFAASQTKVNKSCTYKGEKRTGTYYRMNIYGDGLTEIPTKCSRKLSSECVRNKSHLVHGIKVIPVGKGDYYGFEIDGNRRFVLGNFTVTHNTSLSKEGISKILGREFAFISLGGAGDASFLEGHSYTYEGSLWGKIVQILIDSKCMNPVIYFDELDKLSDSARGQEITGILTHLIDKSQNSQFHDKYFSEVDFDLSKCLFIFSYNDENLVNPILRDRMYRIKTKGYDCAEKVVIAKKYMLPKIREQINFQEGDIVIPDDVLQYIISTPRFTQKEEGVRNLNRCLEIIHTKLNLFRLMHTENNDIPILGKKVDIKVTFPYTVSKKDVDILIQNDENQNQSLLAMYV